MGPLVTDKKCVLYCIRHVKSGKLITQNYTDCLYDLNSMVHQLFRKKASIEAVGFGLTLKSDKHVLT